jgi:hypothetical protein
MTEISASRSARGGEHSSGGALAACRSKPSMRRAGWLTSTASQSVGYDTRLVVGALSRTTTRLLGPSRSEPPVCQFLPQPRR